MDLIFSGGHKEFHRRHRELCENTLLPPVSNIQSETMANVGDSEVIGSTATVTTSPQQQLLHLEDIDSHPASRVLPYLYLGNAKDAADFSSLQRLGINRVLNVTSQIPGYHEQSGIVYKQLPATDSSHQNLKQYFEQAFDFIG